MRKAAEAEAALKAVGKAASDSSAEQVRAEQGVISARNQEIQALKRESSEVRNTADSWKNYNVQALYGGRSDMGSHLGDMQRQLELETLLNRQRWLGFTTPQSAYAWRQQELQQRRLMNYAEWGGYTTPDQYLSYLQREKTAWSELNSLERDRTQRYGELTAAALAYSNALAGTNKSAGQLAEGGSVLPGIQAVTTALAGVPDQVTTRVTVDDAQGLAQLNAWRAQLAGIPRTVGTEDVIRTAYVAGALDPARLQRISLSLDDMQYRQALAADLAMLHQVPAFVDVSVRLDDAKAEAELAAFMAFIRDHRPVGPSVPVMAGGGAAGGGGGPPPVVSGAPDPGDANAWRNLASAEKDAAAGAENFGTSSKAAAVGLATISPALAAATGFLVTWHLLIDIIIELIAALVPAIVTLVAGLGAFILAGNLAQDTLGRISDRMKAVNTAATATGQAISPLTQNFDKLAGVIRPEFWQLFGDALDLVNGKVGIFSQLAEKTGAVVDRLAGRFVVFAGQASKGLNTFFSVGAVDLQKFGEFFATLGNALMNMIRVTQETHIDQFFLDFLIVVAKFIDLISKLPVPVLAAAVALHAVWLYGGTAFTILTSLLLPVRSLALAFGALAAADSAGGLASLGKDASSWDKFKAVLNDVGNGLGAIPARLGLVSKASEEAGGEAKSAEGSFSGLLATLGSKGGLYGILAAVAVAAVLVSVKLGFMHDATLTWASSLQDAMSKASIFQVVGITASNLAATTIELANAQKTGTGNVTELATAHSQLNTQLGLETTRVGGIAKSYGVDFVGALELLNTAGAKTSDLFTTQDKVWAGVRQQVDGLVQGYKEMGQGITQLQGDVDVQLVTGSDQLKQMAQLNTAWDTWITTVTGGESSFIKVQQDLGTVNTNAGVAGAAMDGLNKQSLALRGAFVQALPDAGKLLDSIRNQTAVLQDGAKGSDLLTRATKDLVAEMAPLTAGNKSAQDSLLALAQEADPAINTWQKLTQWIGKEGAAKAAGDLDNILTQLETPVSNLSADALKLTTALQQDLNPAMATALFNAKGGQKPFQDMASAFEKFGGSSPQFATAARAVAQELLAVTGNSASAKASFVGFAEAMGESPAKANALWAALTTGKGALSTTSKGADDLRQHLGGAKAAVADLGKPGLWGQIEHAFMAAFDGVANWFTQSLPHAIAIAFGALSGFFTQSVPHAAGKVLDFFTGLGRDIGHIWDRAWSDLVSPVVHGFDNVKHAITSGFDGWWKTHGDEVKQVWNTAWDVLARPVILAFDQVKAAVEAGWHFLEGQFSGGGRLISGIFSTFWHLLELAARTFWADLVLAVKAGWDLVSGEFRVAAAVVTVLVKAFWNGLVFLAKVFWAGLQAIIKIAWDVIVGIFSVALDLLTGHWGRAWADIKATAVQVLNALKDFFASVWGSIKSTALADWDAIKGGIEGVWKDISAAASRLWGDLKSGFSTTVGAIRTTWDTLSGIFEAPVKVLVNNVYDGGIARLWNDVMGAIGGPTLPTFKFDSGGRVNGYAPNSDSVNARLSPGEYVLTPEAASGIGYGNLDMLNRSYSGRSPAHSGTSFATGGGPLGAIGNFFGHVGSDIGHFVTGAIDIGKMVAALVTGNTTALANALGGFAKQAGIPASGNLLKMMAGIPASMIGHLISFIKGFIVKAGPGLTATGIVGAAGPGGGAPAANAALARQLMPNWGSGPEWAAWNAVAMAESGWNQFARNPSSGAYGIPQALPPSKMGAAANPPQSNPAAQINWMIGYIRSVYGDPIRAWAHEQADHWYGGGGTVYPARFAAGGPSTPATPWVNLRNATEGYAKAWQPAWNAWNAWARVGRPKSASEGQWQSWRADTEIGWAAEADARGKYGKLLGALQGDPTQLALSSWEPERAAVDLWHGIEHGNVVPASMWGPEKHISYPKGYSAGHIRPSAYVGEHWYPGMHASAYTAVDALQNAYWRARNAWGVLYGPGGAAAGLTTPGAISFAGSAGTKLGPAPDLAPFATLGGPAMPVESISGMLGPGYGFANGGAAGGDGTSLSDVAALFSSGFMPGGAGIAGVGRPDLLARAIAKATSATAAASPARTLSAAAAGLNVENMTINNPVAEPPSQSITRANAKMAFLGGRGVILCPSLPGHTPTRTRPRHGCGTGRRCRTPTARTTSPPSAAAGSASPRCAARTSRHRTVPGSPGGPSGQISARSRCSCGWTAAPLPRSTPPRTAAWRSTPTGRACARCSGPAARAAVSRASSSATGTSLRARPSWSPPPPWPRLPGPWTSPCRGAPGPASAWTCSSRTPTSTALSRSRRSPDPAASPRSARASPARGTQARLTLSRSGSVRHAPSLMPPPGCRSPSRARPATRSPWIFSTTLPWIARASTGSRASRTPGPGCGSALSRETTSSTSAAAPPPRSAGTMYTCRVPGGPGVID